MCKESLPAVGLAYEEGIENLPPWKPLSIVSEVCIHKVWGAIIAPTSGSFPTMIFLSGFLIHCDLLLSFELMQDIFSEVSDFFFFYSDRIYTYFNKRI